MKKALKISVSILLLALAVAVTQIPARQVEADTLSTSKDTDFQLNGTILVKYTGTAQSVSVPASVTEIGAEAFADHTEIEKLSFAGNNVEQINYRAFAGCTGLKELVLPDSVTTLGNGAFSNCTSLEKITLGKSLKNWGIGPFTGCRGLKSLSLSKDNEAFVLSDDCLYDAAKTKLYLVLPGRDKDSYPMPSTVTDIAEYAFWGNDKIKSITIGNNLKTIPDYAFSNCKSLVGITIPYSVTSIGIRAFSDCVNLETVVIPSAVSGIHETAFDGCPKLVISADTGTVAQRFYEDWKQRNQAEYEDTGNTTEEPQDPPKEDNRTSGEEVSGTLLGSTYVVGNRAVVMVDNSAAPVYGETSPGGSTSVVNEDLAKGTDIPKYTVAFDSILADQAFYRSHDVSDYTIPEQITEIGEFAFARSNLTEAVIPSGVTTIRYAAFYHCDYLRKVEIPKTVTSIAPKAFDKSMWLETWLAGTGDDFLIVGDGILLAYRGNDSHVVLPDNVKHIAPEVFAGNTGLVSVTLPDSLIEIGEDAFLDCRNLVTVEGGRNVRVIRDRAFKGCPLASAHVPGKVEYLGLESFDFSDTSVGTSLKVVVFENSTALPKPCYETDAGRLSNASARGMILGDTFMAVVPDQSAAEHLAGSVLDSSVYGFKGIIAYINSEERGLLTCLATTCSEEEFSQLYIPDQVEIDGRKYQVTGKDKITQFGTHRQYETGTLTVANDSQVLTGAVNAALEGNDGCYELRIADDATAYESLNRAYQAVYREDLPRGVFCAEISLVDVRSGVPITKMGGRALQITAELPGNVTESLRILTTDRNGQLENVSYTRDGNRVSFIVSHLSPFAFCNVGSTDRVYAEGTVSGDNVVANGRLDESPDTGDPIHPKWFLAAGLASLAIGVLFIKKRK